MAAANVPKKFVKAFQNEGGTEALREVFGDNKKLIKDFEDIFGRLRHSSIELDLKGFYDLTESKLDTVVQLLAEESIYGGLKLTMGMTSKITRFWREGQPKSSGKFAEERYDDGADNETKEETRRRDDRCHAIVGGALYPQSQARSPRGN